MNDSELLTLIGNVQSELSDIRQDLAKQRDWNNELDKKITELAQLISNQQGFLNEHVAENSISINTIVSLVTFGAQEIFQYVKLLNEVRDSVTYSQVFATESPKISVIIPTHSNPAALWARTIPSVVAQTHENLEILIVVDGNFPEMYEATVNSCTAVGDPRITVHLAPPTPVDFPETSGLTSEHKQRFDWYRSGNGPFNHGLDIATGEWIAPFSHDDAMHPDGYERVLKSAIQNRWEYCYAPLIRLSPTDQSTIHSFPPRSHNFGVQGSLIHSSLTMFRYDYRDGLVGFPNDYGLVRRMMLCGVRMGTITDAASDYYPSALWP